MIEKEEISKELKKIRLENEVIIGLFRSLVDKYYYSSDDVAVEESPVNIKILVLVFAALDSQTRRIDDFLEKQDAKR